jgi:phosphomethylpyrimidine synthase
MEVIFVIISIEKTKEFKQGLLDKQSIQNFFTRNDGVSYIHHRKNPVLLGTQFLLKVNASVGISDLEPKSLTEELKKIEAISLSSYAPDLIMDHTPIHISKPLWKYLIEDTDFPIGTVPVYTVHKKDIGIEKNVLLDRISEMAESGINFMTFHPTATRELFNLAKTTRTIPTSSWGGTLVLDDMFINNREVNIIAESFIDILEILNRHNVTISIGSVFRPARIKEALDAVHVKETEEQRHYIDLAKSKGVNVIMEGIGHIQWNMISKYCDLIRPYDTPLMPLGPMLTDAAIGFDHVNGANGSLLVAIQGNVGIINSVTRAEHLGGVPSTENVMEGLMSARVTAHAVNLTRFNQYSNVDNTISDKRANGKTCMVNGGLFNISPNPENKKGCNRCNEQCPLNLIS